MIKQKAINIRVLFIVPLEPSTPAAAAIELYTHVARVNIFYTTPASITHTQPMTYGRVEHDAR